MKAGEDAHIGRADTINRLSRSLEDSQRQCQEMLEAGTGQELGRIKLQLQDALASKSITEDMNSAIQDELRELREQVTMYESASQYGVLPGGSSNHTQAQPTFSPDDSYAQLGINPTSAVPKWMTPESAR